MASKYKLIKIFNIFLVSVLCAGALTGVGVLIYNLIPKTVAVDTTFKYTDYITNFALSSKSYNDESISVEARDEAKKDKAALDFYNSHTRSIAIRPYNSTELTIGTIWSYPNPSNDGRYYFATNIHVIRELLSLDSYGFLNENWISNNFSVFVNSLQNNNEFSQSYNIRLYDLRVERVGLTTEYSNCYNSTYYTNTYSNFPWNYTDFAILSTTTNLFDAKTSNKVIDFVDTQEEFDRAINSKYLYIAGFPAHTSDESKVTDYITAKYENSESIGQKIYTSTAAQKFGGLNAYKSNHKLWLDIFTQGNYAKPGYLSFANQLILPKLNLGGGSSGSVICFYDEVDNKIKPLSIWWGVYEQSLNGVTTKIEGASDLFFSPSYYIGYNHAPGYSSLYNLMWDGNKSLN